VSNSVIPFPANSQSGPSALLTREQVGTAAAIYLRVKFELKQFDGVDEAFADEHAYAARESYIRQCYAGRAR
jgi:hypothetical protein